MAVPMLSEDGFWKFENGEWVPTEKQNIYLSNGAVPHNSNLEASKSNKNTHNDKIIPDNLSSKKSKLAYFGAGLGVTILAAILVISSLSPGTISLLDELRDSDGDGISDYDELIAGTNPELRDSDNDLIDDNDDDCPYGEVNWDSTIVSDWDGDGCKDNTEDYDDDNDGILDEIDNCDLSNILWVWSKETDNDEDGCHDGGDLDDDNDGWSDTKEIQCNTDSLDNNSLPDDLDGDMICDSVDEDDDGDGVDDLEDIFPRNDQEWSDFDEDGIGDNEDTDDDNDGIWDIVDMNDNADVGVLLSFDYFELYTQMDYFDSYTELYICVYIDSFNNGCVPDSNFWSVQTYTNYSLDSELFLDLNDREQNPDIQICAFDDDVSEDDYIDINPSHEFNCYRLVLDISWETGKTNTLVASGVPDSTGWDGELTFTYTMTDLRQQRTNQFEWDFNGQDFTLTYLLNYSDYTIFRAKDHTVDYYDISTYARFATPDEQYVITLAGTLKSMAIQNGYTTDLEIAEFIYAFVGDIQYILDIEGSNISEYPKYPIEMLWEASGDCEDAAILYISLMEAINYDAMLGVGLVKSSSDDEWGGHAWALLHLPGESVFGTYFLGIDEESDLKFFFVEATAYYDGVSHIGRNPWYDIDDVTLYDVE